jgi:hypothetical protein
LFSTASPGRGGERVEDLVLVVAPRVAGALGERAHVRQQIGIVRQLGADGEIDQLQPAVPEEGEQALDGRHHRPLDAIEAVGAERLLATGLEPPSQAVVARAAGVLHVDDHQRDRVGIEREAGVELVRVVSRGGHLRVSSRRAPSSHRPR